MPLLLLMLTMQFNLASLRRAWLGRIAVVEIVDYFLCMVKSERIVPLPILVISLLFDSKLDLPTSSYLPSIQYIIDFPFFLVVDYNRWGGVIVLTWQWIF